MALIVAMSMKEHLVTQVVIVAVAINVINFQDVLIFEMQFTPATFSLLLLQESRFGLMHHRMGLKTLAPVKHIAIIWTCCSSHFGMPLDACFAMQSHFCALWGCKNPLALLFLMPVFLDHPLLSLV